LIAFLISPSLDPLDSIELAVYFRYWKIGEKNEKLHF